MRRVLLCTGILGGGTALTFAAAALAATLLPGGTVVPASNMFRGGFEKGPPPAVVFPQPEPVPQPIVVDDGKSGIESPAPVP